MPSTDRSTRTTTKKAATTKKVASTKASATRKVAAQKAVAGARARKSAKGSATKIKRLTVEDLLATSPEETMICAEGRQKLRKLEREIADRAGRGSTIGGEPAPGTPEDTKARIDRGIVKPIDL